MPNSKSFLSEQLRDVADRADNLHFEAQRLDDEIVELAALAEDETECEPDDCDDVRLALDAVRDLVDDIIHNVACVVRELHALVSDDKPAPAVEATTTETVEA